MAVLQLVSAIRKQQSTVSNHHSLLAIVFLLGYKFNISYQETAIGNEYHQLETISNLAAGGAAITNAASSRQRKATAQRTSMGASEAQIRRIETFTVKTGLLASQDDSNDNKVTVKWTRRSEAYRHVKQTSGVTSSRRLPATRRQGKPLH